MTEITILYALLASAVFCVAFYLKSVGENFQWSKAIATVSVGLIIGAVSYLSGKAISEKDVLEQLAIYGSLVALVDTGLKILWRKFLSRKVKMMTPTALEGRS